MSKPEWPDEFTADNWRLGDNLALYGDFFKSTKYPIPSDRKFRLLMVAAAHTAWENLPDSRSRLAVAVAERHADGPCPEALLEAQLQTEWAYHDVAEMGADDDTAKRASKRLALTAHLCTYFEPLQEGLRLPVWVEALEGLGDTDYFPPQMRALHLALFHDLIRNPFRPVAFDPQWRSETVVALASAIYAERAFDRMPILADALEEAGCDDAVVLAHCRNSGPHARGCWVVDGLLGKV